MPTTAYTSSYTGEQIDAKLEAMDGKADKIVEVNHGTNDTTFTLTTNVMHIWGKVTSLTLSLPTDTDSYLDEYLVTFTAGADFQMYLPNTVKWVQELKTEENKVYQVSIQGNLAGWLTNGMTTGGGSGGGSGDTNIIEIVKVNGTALTPDSNKAVDVSVPTESTVSEWGFTKNTGTYSKPSDGIPATDLASAVQTSLGKADSALQSFTETDPVFTASAAHGIGSTDISNWNGKYTKPSGGIPKTDLATAVQTSLGKADTALQSYTETDPTVPSWAKASSKPSYTASEVGAVPTTRTVNGKALSANVTLTASDVGAVDASDVVTIYSGSTTPSSSLGSDGDIYIKTS